MTLDYRIEDLLQSAPRSGYYDMIEDIQIVFSDIIVTLVLSDIETSPYLHIGIGCQEWAYHWDTGWLFRPPDEIIPIITNAVTELEARFEAPRIPL